jgi:phenylacetaldehyde dehydrogenase
MAAAVSPNLDESALQFIAREHHLLINGKWVPAASGKTFPTYNPATGEVLSMVAEGDRQDVDAAVFAARQAFDHGPWRRMTASERGRMIWKLADLLEQHTEEFASLESLDNGKPLTVARVADLPLAVDMFRYMAGWTTKIEGNTIPISVPYTPGARYHAFTLRDPVGVVAQVIPWNFPLLMAAWKLAPALAAGCTIILKPAEQTPLTALRLGELICEAGFPDGVVNIIPGYGETAGAALAAHPMVDKIAFTGSTEVGKLIVHAATGNLKKVTLELGGKSPNVIMKDADLEVAIPGAASAIFFNQGQCCCAGSRLYVHQSLYNKVVDGIAEVAKKICVGPGWEPGTQLGPLVSEEQMNRVKGYIDAGLIEGACALTGSSKKVGNRGYFVEPTVLTHATSKMKVVREEIFGPVVAALPYETLDEVVEQANDSSYGLAAGIWTNNLAKAHQLAVAMRAGTVYVNCYNIFDAALPFGGYKESGWGREMGHNAIDAYTETKSVCMKVA